MGARRRKEQNQALAVRQVLPTTRAIPGLAEPWQQFLLAIIFGLLLPLLPIFLEVWQSGSSKATTLTLSASLYVISIGVSSRSMALFGLTVLASLFNALAFQDVTGERMGVANAPPHVEWVAAGSIAVVFIIHFLERFNRHVVGGAPFFEFWPRQRTAS